MATNSTIEWTESTWNPVTGCTKVSAGCLNCYAERMAQRLQAMGRVNHLLGGILAMTDDKLREVEIYTDGAARGNPGPGGYGVRLRYGEHVRELSGGFRLTTNNRMELLGVITGLEALKSPCAVTIHSDSKYVVQAISRGSVHKWRAKGWFRTRTAKAKNIDLWERYLAAAERHDVRVVWVPGHAGVADNERCDELAVAAAMEDDLPEDTGYQAAAEAGPSGPAAQAGATDHDIAAPASQQLTFDL